MEDVAHAVQHLGCPIVDFPITYLGIPLTLRRPTAAQLQPVVDKVAGKLPSWKAWLMNKAGRLAFVKAILSAIHIHQLLVLAPTKKTLKLLVRIERGFLWAGHAEANGGNCHVNLRRIVAQSRFAALVYTTSSTLDLPCARVGSSSAASMTRGPGAAWTCSSRVRNVRSSLRPQPRWSVMDNVPCTGRTDDSTAAPSRRLCLSYTLASPNGAANLERLLMAFRGTGGRPTSTAPLASLR